MLRFKCQEVYHEAAYREMLGCIRRRRIYTRVVLILAFILLMLGAVVSLMKQDYQTGIILLMVSLPLPLFEMRLYLYASSLHYVYHAHREGQRCDVRFEEQGLLEDDDLSDRYILYDEISELYESRHYLFIIYQESQYLMLEKDASSRRLMAFLQEKTKKRSDN